MRVCGQSGRKGKEEQEKTAKRRCEWETRKRERQILWEEKGEIQSEGAGEVRRKKRNSLHFSAE